MLKNYTQHMEDVSAPDPRDEPYVQLWLGVFNHAIREAMDFNPAALRWLFCATYNADTALVCEFAGIDLEYVRPRLQSVVVLFATTLARGREPHFKSRRISWLRARLYKQERALEFLNSSLGRHLIATANLPTDQASIERTLEKAILMSRDERIRPEAVAA